MCVDSDETWDQEEQRPSNMMFYLSSADKGELSGARSGKTTPEETYRHHTEDQGRQVKAVWGLAVADLSEEKLHLHDDSGLLAGPPTTPEGHTWLDLKHLPTGRGNPAKQERERMRSMLVDIGALRYSPTDAQPQGEDVVGVDQNV